MIETKVKWIDELNFVGLDSNGKGTLISAGQGPGVSPMQMLLLGLGGCSGSDVVHILKKQRQELTALEVEVKGKRTKEYPRPYEEIVMFFRVKGKNLDPKKVKRAISLSFNTYCGARASLAGTAKISWDCEIIQEDQLETEVPSSEVKPQLEQKN